MKIAYLSARFQMMELLAFGIRNWFCKKKFLKISENPSNQNFNKIKIAI